MCPFSCSVWTSWTAAWDSGTAGSTRFPVAPFGCSTEASSLKGNKILAPEVVKVAKHYRTNANQSSSQHPCPPETNTGTARLDQTRDPSSPVSGSNSGQDWVHQGKRQETLMGTHLE